MTTEGLSPTSLRLNSYSVPLTFSRPDGKCGLGVEAGTGGVGHAGRASRPVLNLVPDIGQHRAGVVAILLVGAPGEVWDFMLPRQRHQLMPARMEIDPVDPVAEAVMRLEFRQMAIGEAGEFLHLLVAGDGTERLATLRRPRRFAVDGRPQHRIASEGVKPAGGLCLVQDFVGAVAP